MNLMNILMLEDSPFDAELVQRLLKKEFPNAGIEVVGTRAGFINALTASRPTIILSDNSLPDTNAREALEISRRMYPFIPFIMVSGTVGEEMASEIIRLGADDYILKDRLARLPAAIDTAIVVRVNESEKQAALDLLRVNEEKYRTLIGRVTDAFISFDHHFCYTYLNARAGNMIHRDPEELIGKHVWTVFPEAVGSATYYAFQKAMQTQEYVFNEDYFAPLDLWQENHIYPSTDGLSVFIRDISKQKRAQAAVRDMEQKVVEQRVQHQKNITRSMLRAQESERARLGREMHDNINQILTASKIFLTKGKRDLPEDIRYPVELIDKAIHEIRLLSRRYVTPLKDVQLDLLLEGLVRDIRQNTGVTAELIYRMEGDLPDDELQLNIYRMVQEQLNNIIKYAAARNVKIEVAGQENEIKVIVTDDGVGFDVSAKRKGIGLANMTHRVETFDGSMDIISFPGNGCTIRIYLPLIRQD